MDSGVHAISAPSESNSGKSASENKDKKGFWKSIKSILSKKKSPTISKPTGFEKGIHIEVDESDPLGLRGLPEEWRIALEQSELSKSDIVNNPDAVINCLNYQFQTPSLPTLNDMLDVDKMLRDKNFFINEDPRQYYRGLKEVLGEGGFSTVYKATNIKTEEVVAVKVTNLEELINIRKELALQKTCNHPNIVHVGDCFNWKDKLWIVMEFMGNGSLTSLLGEDRKFTEGIIAYICKSVLTALEALHRDNRIHRDIKSDNILLNGKGEIKLADFGLACRLESSTERRKSVVGTPLWMAPELIRGGGYTSKIDIWSLGITILEMVNGEPPHYNQPPLKALLLIHTSPSPTINNPSDWSDEFNDFLEKALKFEPDERFTASQLLQHPFINFACTAEDFMLFVNEVQSSSKNK